MIDPVLDGVLTGIGIGNVPLNDAAQHLADGKLIRVLLEWEQSLPGYHFYYLNRRNASPAFRLMLDAIRYSV